MVFLLLTTLICEEALTKVPTRLVSEAEYISGTIINSDSAQLLNTEKLCQKRILVLSFRKKSIN